MKKLLEQYFDSLSSQSLEYSHYNSIAKKQAVLHIPNWEYLGKDKLEWIIEDYFALIYEDKGSVFVETGNGKNKISRKTVIELLNELETGWKSKSSDEHTYYLGLLSYDLGGDFLTNRNDEPIENFYNLPSFYIIIPGNSYHIDHTQQSIRKFKIDSPCIPPEPLSVPAGILTKSVLKSESKKKYKNKINMIQNLIRDGEVYQLNYTTRFSSSITVSGYDFFRAWYRENPAPFSFYARLPHFECLSNSPERFLMLENQTINTEPIKGTIHRDSNADIDHKLQQQLLDSEKDAAELSMIVDLLRNDLSHVCEPGSVIVKSHKQLKSFSNVHHLVSTISGQLEQENTFVELLESAFPGGSITGCPKQAAMRYIRQLENHNRSFYTGSFFIRFPTRDTFDSSILIRTAIKEKELIHFQAGGGIVIDSDGDSEYAECLSKADSFLKTLEQINGRDYQQ